MIVQGHIDRPGLVSDGKTCTATRYLCADDCFAPVFDVLQTAHLGHCFVDIAKALPMVEQTILCYRELCMRKDVSLHLSTRL